MSLSQLRQKLNIERLKLSDSMTKNSIKLFDRAKKYKNVDKIQKFLDYIDYVVKQPKGKKFKFVSVDFNKYFEIKKTNIDTKSFNYSLLWNKQNPSIKWDEWYSYWSKIFRKYKNNKIQIHIESDLTFDLSITLTSEKDLTNQLIINDYDLPRMLLGVDKDKYVKYSSNEFGELFLEFDETQFSVVTYTITQLKPVVNKPIKQSFQAGGECFFDAIKEDMDINDRKDKTIINKIEKLKLGYLNGVSSEQAEHICQILGISVSLYSPDQKTKIDINCSSNNIKNIKMINTKDNHVELFKLKEFNLSNIEMIAKQKELIKNKKYHCIQGFKDIKVILTDKEKYINDEYDEKDDDYNNFVKPFTDCKLKLDTDIYNFINNGYSQNRCIVYKESENDFSHLMNDCGGICIDLGEKFYKPNTYTKLYDHSKSYSRFKECKYYIGFPSVFTDFCKGNFNIEFIKKHIGYYMISNIDYSKCNKNIIMHLDKLKIFNHDVFTSVELCFYYNLGIRFDCIVGAYCMESIDIPKFTDDEINNKKYSIFIGKLGMENKFHTYKVFTTKEHAEKINYEFGTSTEIYEGNKYINVQYPKSNKYNYMHIAGFFCSYSRIQILEQLFLIDYNNVECIEIDGIYTNNDINVINNFRLKPTRENKKVYDDDQFIYGRNIETRNNYILPELNDYYTDKNIYLLGAGGTGKTHWALTMYKNLDILYLSKSYILGADKNLEYGVKCSVFGNFKMDETTVNYRAEFMNKPHPNIIFLDEYSMEEDTYYDNVIRSNFPYSKVIIANDITRDGRPYQLCLNSSSIFTIFDDFHVEEFTKNYRFKDDKILQLCNTMRYYINMKYPLINFVKNNFINCSFDDVIRDYDYTKDYILCSMRNGRKDGTCDYVYEWTRKFNNDKNLVLVNKDGYFNGQIVFGNVNGIKMERRDAFSFHSVQGKTLKNCKIYIDIRKIFDMNQVYVAVSRAEYYDQIRIIV